MLNVVEHGADATGVHDSTEILTRLHATGQRIFYPNGIYRFNGKTLDLSGGVEFETPSGVTVRNDISSANILQFDDFGNLIGLQQNHLELNEAKLGGPLPIDNGSLVTPPLSTRDIHPKIALLAHWYNDGGLEHRRITPGAGWIGWYYWTWNFHDAEGDGYDPSRHPLLGFYKGDDPVVLDWQCYWLREYGVTGVVLYLPSELNSGYKSWLENWEKPETYSHWVYQLFHHVPNFKQLKYVMSATSPYANSTPEVMAQVEAQWLDLFNETYFKYPNFYSINKNGKTYPLIYLHEEGGLTGVFDNYSGCASTLNFYRRMAQVFQDKGFGGIALLGRHGISSQQADFDALEREGVLHFSGNYAEWETTGETFAQRVQNYAPPTDLHTILNIVTSCHTHTPHPSQWQCPGSTPELFGQLLQKAVDHIEATDMPRIITCYNIAEWAEGGPGLQPNMQDRFGYLQAVRNVVGE